MHELDIIIIVLLILGVATFIGGPLGLGFHGSLDKTTIDTHSTPSLLNILSWCWNGLSFMFGLMVFQVDGCPAWISFIYDIFGVLILWIILKWVRGTPTGV